MQLCSHKSARLHGKLAVGNLFNKRPTGLLRVVFLALDHRDGQCGCNLVQAPVITSQQEQHNFADNTNSAILLLAAVHYVFCPATGPGGSTFNNRQVH